MVAELLVCGYPGAPTKKSFSCMNVGEALLLVVVFAFFVHHWKDLSEVIDWYLALDLHLGYGDSAWRWRVGFGQRNQDDF